MKNRSVFLLALVLFVTLILWALLHKKSVGSTSLPAEPQSQPVQRTETNHLQLLKSTASPSNTIPAHVAGVPDEVVEYVRKSTADIQYDWKQPINFYGRVVDENNVAVSGASIHFTWNDISETGTSEANTVSDNNGGFSLTDRRGKRLYIEVGKEGYYSSGNSRSAVFEYANPADGLFKPDAGNPVVFHLRKKGIGADLIHGVKFLGSRIEGTLSYVDLMEGKNSLTPPGDLTVQFTRSEKNSDKKFDWTFKLGVVDGGLIESTDEFMFLAPEDGYQPTFEISHKASDPDWTSQEKHKFFIKSQDGKHYARIEITIIPDYNQTAAYDLTWYLNPNGSRNLEPK